jgi:hypothetical protein
MSRAGTKAWMSKVRVASTLALAKSPSVSTAKRPFAYSYPLEMSFQGTSTPSAEQKRLYSIGLSSVR